jgi:hypothetical protein
MLVRLIDKSLLRAERDGRYNMHELLRQFTAQKLDADSGAVTRTRDRHSAFYLGGSSAMSSRSKIIDNSRPWTRSSASLKMCAVPGSGHWSVGSGSGCEQLRPL